MTSRLRAGLAYLRTANSYVHLGLVVLAAGGITVRAAGGLVWEWLLAVATLMAAAWLLTPVLCAAGPQDVRLGMRRLGICLAPLALLGLEGLRGSALLGCAAPLASALAVAAPPALAAYYWVLPRLADRRERWGAIFQTRGPVFLVAGLWAAVVGFLTIARWWSFAQFSQDMAILEQATYNTLHGHFLAYSCDLRHGGVPFSRFGDHFEPIILLFLPLYALWQTAVWFLLAQTLVMASGAVALWGLARHYTRSGAFALLLAGVYLLHPATMEAMRWEVHLSSLSGALLLWGVYLALVRRPVLALTCLVLAMGCKENIAVTVFMVGWYLIWQHRRRLGVALVVLGPLWFAAAVWLIIPHFSPTGAWFYSGGLRSPLTDTSALALQTYLHGRLGYLTAMVLPVAGLCLLSPAGLIAAPELLVNCLSCSSWGYTLVGWYNVTAVAGLMVGAAHGFAWLRRHVTRGTGVEPWRVHCALLIALGLVATQALLPVLRTHRVSVNTQQLGWADLRALHALVGQIPDDVPVLVNDGALASHLARRLRLHFAFRPDSVGPDVMHDVRQVDYVAVRAPLTAEQERQVRRQHGLALIGQVAHRYWVWRVIHGADDKARRVRPPHAERSGL